MTTKTDLRTLIEEELRQRVRRGEEPGLHTSTDFKAVAEKTAERRPARRKPYPQFDRDPIR
jgi:hypothetical protein